MMIREKHKVLVQFAITFALTRGNICPLLGGSVDPEASTSITEGCQHGFLSNLDKEGARFPTGASDSYSLVSSGWSESANKFTTEQKVRISNLPSNADSLPGALSDNETTERATMGQEEADQENFGAVGFKSGETQTSDEGITTENASRKPRKKKKNKKNRKAKQLVSKQDDGKFLSPLEKSAVDVQKSPPPQPDQNLTPSYMARKNINQKLDEVNQKEGHCRRLGNLISDSTDGESGAPTRLPKISIPQTADTVTGFSGLVKYILEDEIEIEENMKEKGLKRLEMALQPYQSTNSGEIYPGVIKGKWSDVVHKSQPSLQEIIKILKQIESSKDGVSKDKLTGLLNNKCSDFASKIFEAHLQLLNNQNHLPLHKLSYEDYNGLKFMWNLNPELVLIELKKRQTSCIGISKSELHRRIITFTNQVMQKTIVENWGLIKNSFIERKKYKPSFLNKFEKYFRLQQEFPKTILASEEQYLEEYPKDLRAKNPYETTEKLLQSVISDFEEFRRNQVATDLIKHVPKWELSQEVRKDLRKAEKYNGVVFWNVFHFIHYLGLGKQDDIDSWDSPKVIKSIETLNMIVSSPDWYSDIDWHQSADRFWLKRVFKEEYDQKLKRLCEKGKTIRTWECCSENHSDCCSCPKTLDFQAGENLTDHQMIVNLIHLREEEKLRVGEHGLNEKILLLIKILRDKHTSKLDGHTNWQAVWNHFPPEIELTSDLQEFAQLWINEVFP
ncbi:hypothetical protein PGT21_026369 [Puccinia graminis f. sp. tritici]|uniref:Uncharacterized protein n=1 Tax=Puccinia graminis f. sp. tritici TaxID=56615 RepID=A0A5B0RZU8_PUCGR|nr:hypothetical protein PGT21_026369 [Puccinia graminis f. sp. tritici]KAA1131117.1 hypothetical protein PGTUg99_010558 [Puccinia graminis f. sp. tritici]